MLQLQLESLEDTERLGRILARQLVCEDEGGDFPAPHQSAPWQLSDKGVVIGLTGTLGAGKTHLVQAIISAFGIKKSEVTSPTFSLVQTYTILKPQVLEGAGAGEASTEENLPLVVHHLDAYRIADDDEFLELGVEDMLGQPRSLSLIEWAGKVEACLPRDTLWIDIEYLSASCRTLHFSSNGGLWNAWLGRLQNRFVGESF